MTDPRTFNEAVIDEFRASGGKLGGMLAETRILLLTTTGARSGRTHTTPLAYVVDGTAERMVLFASNRGAEQHPDWFGNLRAEPDALVELGTRTLPVRAEQVDDPEYDRLHNLFTAQNPGTEKHHEWTERRIPLVTLRPR